jgi:uncharacterized protein (DUF1015 family)
MAVVRPFSALRPRSELASRIASVPYDVVNADEARALAADPLSFLHVSRAEIDLPADTNPYADDVYARAVANFDALKQSSLVHEPRPAIYLYRLRMGRHEQTGVAASFSVDEYQRDLIKKHEKTRPDKENDRTRHIIDTRAQSGPVLMTYRDDEAVDRAVSQGTTSAPLYDFAAPDAVQHTIWRTEPDVGNAIVSAFADVPALYIADGHHRAASAARAHEHFAGQAQQVPVAQGAPSRAGGTRTSVGNGGSGGRAYGATPPSAEHAWFLAVAFPDRQMQILPYHRTVKDLAGQTPEALLASLRTKFPVEPGSATPRRKGECAMYLGGTWYTLQLDAGAGAASVAASVAAGATAGATVDPIASLDVSRLQDHVLAPLLRIQDQRTDKRIDFVGGIRGTGELERLVSRGDAAVAFSLFPTTVADLMTIADAGAIMPPKSTWFEPKLRDGLLTHVI